MKLDINIRIFFSALFLLLLASAFNATVSHAQTPVLTISQNNNICAGNPVSGGIFTQIDKGGNCEFQPDTQKISFFKLELCTEAPTGPTTSIVADNSKCKTFFQNENATFVTVEKNKGSPIGKVADYSPVPHGIYTHGIVTMGTVYKFKTSVTFDAAMKDNGDNAGTTCVTKTSSQGIIYGRHNGLNTFAKGNVDCRSGAVAEEIEIAVNTMTTDAQNDCNHLVNIVSKSGVGSVYLVESDMTLLDGVGAVDTDQIKDGSTGCGSGVDNGIHRVLGVMKFATPLEIGPSTAGLEVKYNNSRGMAINMDSDNNHKFYAWDMAFFDFTMKVKKARARGAWR